MSPGTMNGLTRPAPRSRITVCAMRSVSMPPIPVPNTTPPRSATTSGSPASCHASFADAIPNWVERSVRRASFTSSHCEGSKSGTSAASVTGRSEGSNRSMRRIPFRPDVRPDQNSSTPVPTGVRGPMPVMKTLVGAPTLRRGEPQLLLDERDGLSDRLHALHLGLGDLDVPLLLEGEDGLDEVEGVGVQVLREPRVGHHLCLVHRELLGKDLAHPRLDLCLVHRSSLGSPVGTARHMLGAPASRDYAV